MVWVARGWSHGKITEPMRALLVGGCAARAWITWTEVEHDREGPDISAGFAWQHEGDVYQGRFFGSYDAMHLALGFPDFSAWLGRAITEGGTLTVLFPEDAPSDYSVYGKLELYIERTLAQAFAEHQDARTEQERTTHLDDIARLMRGPIGPMQGEDWREYFDLAAKVSGMATTGNTTLPQVVDAAVAAIAAGTHDAAPIPRLSELCKVYMPGLWAAR
jgi:hypothetical protein